MRKKLFFAVFLLSINSVCLAQDPASAPIPTPTPRRIVMIHNINTSAYPRITLSVKIREGEQLVSGLKAADFRLTENQLPYPVAFEPPPPRFLAIVVDTSGSMIQAMSTVKSALKELTSSLGKDDQLSIIGFSRSVTVHSPLQPDKAAARGAIENLVANGESALYDALFSGAESLKDARGHLRGIVLITDSKDDDGYGKAVSTHSVADALKRAKEVVAPIFTIALGDKPDRALLTDWSNQTRGIAQSISAADELGTALTKVLGSLTLGYDLGYTTTAPADGQLRQLRVEIGDAGGEGQYSAPTAKAPSNPQASTPVTGTRKKKDATNAIPPLPQTPRTAASAGGDRIDTATQIALNVWLPLPFENRGRYYSFTAAAGQTVRVTVSGGAFEPCVVRAFTTSNGFGEAHSYQERMSPLEFFAPEEKIILASRGGSDCSMLVRTFDYFDAGTSRDAGIGEASALAIRPREDTFGYLSTRGDAVDSFKLTGISPGAWTLIVRPSPSCSLKANILNELGEQIKNGTSKNAGAGISLQFQSSDSKAVHLQLEVHGDQGKRCAYVLRYGMGELEIPAQPEIK